MVHQVVAGSTVLSSFTFSHDAASSVARIVETYDTSSGIAGRTVTNTYDKTRRLLTETAVEPTETVATTYGYDKANNRTSKIVATTPAGGATTTETHGYVYGSISNGLNSNQVWKWIKPGGAEVVYTYDANGNRATRAETIGGTPKTDTYTWDHWNRLTELDLQSKAAAHNGAYEYGYDHRTRRVVRDESAISGRTRDLVIYSGGTSVQEHQGENGQSPASAANPDMEYIRGSDWGGGVGGILYTARAGVVSWAHYNGRGDVVTRTSDTGSLTYAATYEAFGTRTQEAGTNPDRQRANTKEEDPTGLLNEGHRYRDLELGMFISRDPAGFVDGPNVYTYVVQNPWSAFDPEGLSEASVGGESAPSPDSAAQGPAGGADKGTSPSAEIDDASARAVSEYLESLNAPPVKKPLPPDKLDPSNGGPGLHPTTGAPGYVDAFGDWHPTFCLSCHDNTPAARRNMQAVLEGPTGWIMFYTDVALTVAPLAGGQLARFGKAPGTIAGTVAGTGAESVNAGAALRSKLSALENAQQVAARTRTLPDGRVRYYGPETRATNPGATRGASYVTEHNPQTGQVRSWMESYDQAGNVNRVHPKMIDGQQVQSQHYPPTAREIGQ